MKREFTEAEIENVIDDAIELGTMPWRHGHKQTYVFEFEGKYWRCTLNVHHDDGIQTYGPVTCTEVHQVERTVKVWEVAP